MEEEGIESVRYDIVDMLDFHEVARSRTTDQLYLVEQIKTKSATTLISAHYISFSLALTSPLPKLSPMLKSCINKTEENMSSGNSRRSALTDR